MRKVLFLFLLLIPVALAAQPVRVGVKFVTSLPATCTALGAAGADVPVSYQGDIYQCTSTNTWSKVANGATFTPGTAGAVDLGSTSKWFQDIYFGHSGSFYAKAVITPTANRTITFPDADITVAGSASALTSGRVAFTTTGGLLTTNSALVASSTALGILAAGSSSTAALQVFDTGTGLWYNGGSIYNLLQVTVSGSGSGIGFRSGSSNGGIVAGAGYQYLFSSTANPGNSSHDTGMDRLAAGVIRATNGTSGSGSFAVGTAAAPCKISAGSGSPESAVTGNVCDIYLRTDGGASTTLYVKQSGSGNTGWVAK